MSQGRKLERKKWELNQTTVTEFIIIDLKNFHQFRMFLFILLLLLYFVIVTGNSFIVTLVAAMNPLHSPMYFFLGNLSLSDVLLTTDIVPNMLHILWTGQGTVSIIGCIVQFYIFGSFTATECLLLTVMSYDRCYLAICNPLRYSSIMTITLCKLLICLSWLIGFTPTFPVAICVYKLQFRDLNTIDHFFCDLAPFLQLACSDTVVVKMLAFLFSFFVTLFPFLFNIMTYVSILYTIFRMRSAKRRQKAFSTCSSHLTVVSLYYGTLFILYGIPLQTHLIDINKLLSLLYTIVTPLLNPVVYSQNNHEIGKAFKKLFRIKSSRSDFK